MEIVLQTTPHANMSQEQPLQQWQLATPTATGQAAAALPSAPQVPTAPPPPGPVLLPGHSAVALRTCSCRSKRPLGVAVTRSPGGRQTDTSTLPGKCSLAWPVAAQQVAVGTALAQLHGLSVAVRVVTAGGSSALGITNRFTYL